jgi:hypothetical protein
VEVTLNAALQSLATGPLFPFASWDRSLVPQSPGVYSVWRSDCLIYIGMAGRSQEQKAGLRGRLTQHDNGRRSGDQLCMYVSDRLVLPELTREQVLSIAAGTHSLDHLTKAFIHREVAFRFVVCTDPGSARALEKEARMAGVPGAGVPMLNPHPGRPPQNDRAPGRE